MTLFRGMLVGSIVWLAIVSLATSHTTAQVVQLPTFHVFSVDTTVVVPDRGSAYLGGVRHGALSSSRRGVPGIGRLPGAPLGRRSSAASFSSSGAQVTATIIDHREWDEAVLGAARSTEDRGRADEVSRRAAYLSRHVARRRTVSRKTAGY